MFLTKKIIAALLTPLPLSIFAVLLGLWLIRSTRRQLGGTLLIVTAITTLTLLSLSPVSNTLMATLEDQYRPYLTHTDDNQQQITQIVVLGSGHISDPALPVTSQINATTLARVTEGVRLYKMTENGRLILSGGNVFDDKPEAETMQAVAILMGINEDAITLDGNSLDTKDQARNIKMLVGDDDFILVTSASHMPRSMALFRKQGLSPIAAPTNHTVREVDAFSPRDFLPNAAALRTSEQVIHEYLGLLWARFRGQI